MPSYATQLEAARQGIVTPQMAHVAQEEHMDPEHLRELVAKGEVAIPANVHHTCLTPFGIGFAVILQFKTQTCRTVNQTHNVLFAADAVENILRECFIFHALFLTAAARRQPATE